MSDVDGSNIIKEVLDETRPDILVRDVLPKLPKPPDPAEIFKNLFGE